MCMPLRGIESRVSTCPCSSTRLHSLGSELSLTKSCTITLESENFPPKISQMLRNGMKMDAAPLQTFARVRSLKPGEENVSSSLKIHQKKVIGARQTCTFTDVFYGEQTAELVFSKSAKELVRQCANGYNVSVLVFGETGSENSAFLVGNRCAQVPSSSFTAAAVNSLYSEVESGTRPFPERPSVQGPTEFRVSVKVYEVVGHSVRDLIQSSNQPQITYKYLPWTTEVEGLARQTISTKEEAMTVVRQAWERRTLSHSTVGETHPLSAQFVEFEVEAKYFHLTQPIVGTFTVVRLPGAEALPNFDQSVPIHSSGSSLVTSVCNLGHYIVQLANGDVPAIKSGDPPLRAIMGKYLAANCVTVVMATLIPYVTGTSTDRVLWYMDHFQKIINHPIQNTPAAKKMFTRLSTLLEASSTREDSPDSQSTLIAGSRVACTRENLREQLQSLASTNAALRAENDRLKLRSVMNVASARREVAVESRSQILNPSLSRHAESAAVLPVSSVHQHSRQPINTGFTLNMEHLKTLLDREQAISAELERFRGLADAVQHENDRLLAENGDLKLNVVSLASSHDTMKEELESLRVECVHLQGKVKQRATSVSQHTDVGEGRNLLVGVQVSRLQQELLAIKKELTRVDNINKELHSKMKMLSASYRNRLEQYIRDVTAFLKDHPPPTAIQSGEHLATVLDLLDSMMSRMMESYSSELRQSEAKVGALQELSVTMQNDLEQIESSLKDVYEAVSHMNVQVPQLLLNGLIHAPVAAPRGSTCRIMAKTEASSHPKSSRVKQELMKALNKAIAYVPVAMETLHPHMTKELCTLLELLLAVKLSVLQQMVEEERTHASQPDIGVHMAETQLRELRKENVALSVRCTVAEAQAKQLRMHLNQ